MQEPTWLKVVIDILAIIGGCYSIYKIYKAKIEERIDIKRINKLVEEDLLPPSMKEKNIKPDEYVLFGINQLTLVLDKSIKNLRQALERQKVL